jgi:hypothetical protein
MQHGFSDNRGCRVVKIGIFNPTTCGFSSIIFIPFWFGPKLRVPIFLLHCI